MIKMLFEMWSVVFSKVLEQNLDVKTILSEGSLLFLLHTDVNDISLISGYKWFWFMLLMALD